MAVITQTQNVTSASTAVNVTRTTLSASDTLTYVLGANQFLSLFNTTASPVVVTLTGTAPVTALVVNRYGVVSAAGGKAITVPASGQTIINLDDIGAYLDGVVGASVVTVTGGVGVTAALYV